MQPEIKICGITDASVMEAALDAGADYVGLVFFEASPRHLTLDHAAELSHLATGRARVVALVVDPYDAQLDDIVRTVAPDIIQLHGHETPERILQIADRYNKPILKAYGLSEPNDLNAAMWLSEAGATPVETVALFDAKPPKTADSLPGGNGLQFDWTLLDAWPAQAPFMLSGGLTPENIVEAVQKTRATALDVSSGVELERGRKSPELVRALIENARSAAKAHA